MCRPDDKFILGLYFYNLLTLISYVCRPCERTLWCIRQEFSPKVYRCLLILAFRVHSFVRHREYVGRVTYGAYGGKCLQIELKSQNTLPPNTVGGGTQYTCEPLLDFLRDCIKRYTLEGLFPELAIELEIEHVFGR